MENAQKNGNDRPSYLYPKKPVSYQEATVTTLCGTTDYFKIKKGIQKGCILSPYLFNLYAEHIMWNAGLDELQAGIKISGRYINNLRYADDTTLITESKEALKSSLMRVREKSIKAGLKLIISLRKKKNKPHYLKKKLTSLHLVPSLHDKYKGKMLKQ